MNDVISRLEKWYERQCNGTWEHVHGIKIDTLDNPGWAVEIDLKDTVWESSSWENLKIERSANDWVNCSKPDKKFQGYGDCSKLREILDYFLKHVE